MQGKELLPQIKTTTRNDRYSFHLMKWVQKYQDKRLFVAIATEGTKTYDPKKTQASSLYIGFYDLNAGWLHGSRLSEILCYGAKAGTFAFPPLMRFERIPSWWQDYIAKGKCHIDPEHYLYDDPERWQVEGKIRTCTWCCNHTQREHTEMIPRTSWQPITI